MIAGCAQGDRAIIHSITKRAACSDHALLGVDYAAQPGFFHSSIIPLVTCICNRVRCVVTCDHTDSPATQELT